MSKYFPCILSTNRNVYVWLFQEKLGTSLSLLRLWSLEKNVHNWQESSKPSLEIIECMTKQTRITHKEYFAYKYGTMIFSVSDYTCVMIPNDQILYLKHVKDEPPRNMSTVFRVRVAKPLKRHVRFRVRGVHVRAVYKRTLRYPKTSVC